MRKTNAQRACAVRCPPLTNPQETPPWHEWLFAPLDELLIAGGDSRLALAGDGANLYGCTPRPRAQALAFSSSTASTISPLAYRRARTARQELIEEGAGLYEAFARRVEEQRLALAGCLQLQDTGIVFSPSGTDSQLHVLFLARLVLGEKLTTIIVGADQTGSGTAFTCRGRHFSARTAGGKSVEKGSPIGGWANDIKTVGISLLSAEGAARPADEIDAAVTKAVRQEIALGRKVVLQTMESSKFGWRAPSHTCLERIQANRPGEVQIVIDACQMRIARPRLRAYLQKGCIVLITGSKFFGGPPFCGATLVPAPLAARIAAMDAGAEGLLDYASRWDFPAGWGALRATLPAVPNFGQWLRWEAALLEMRTYYALPPAFRRRALAHLAAAIPALIAASPNLEAMPQAPRGEDDEEMSSPTIFPFLIKQGDGHLGHEEASKLYRALGRELGAALPDDVTDGERRLAMTLCHIGQPVSLPCAGGKAKAALRLCIGARTLTDAWSPDERAWDENIAAVTRQIETIIRKIDLLLRYPAVLDHTDERVHAAAPIVQLRRTA